MGSMTSDYIWFLMPIYGSDTKKPGNAIAMEAVTVENEAGQDAAINSEDGKKTNVDEEKQWEESTGKATYFFKILNRADYLIPENLQGLEAEVEKLIKKINKAMISINFRREPIYIEDEKLYEPDNVKYRFSISKIAELREIR